MPGDTASDPMTLTKDPNMELYVSYFSDTLAFFLSHSTQSAPYIYCINHPCLYGTNTMKIKHFLFPCSRTLGGSLPLS